VTTLSVGVILTQLAARIARSGWKSGC